MILSFKTTINGKPTYFPEKIIIGLYKNQIIPISKACELFRDYPLLVDERLRFVDTSRDVIPGINPKLHTIREDSKGRWYAGMDIHPVIKPGGRYSKPFQFAPVIKCVSVQTIKISWFIDEGVRFPFSVYIDGNVFYSVPANIDLGIKQLAINDGFDSLEDFFAYFDKDFTGVLIHWSDLKY